MNTNLYFSLLLLFFYCALVNGYINDDNMCAPGVNNSILTLLDDIFMQQWDKPNPISLPVACEFKVYSSSYGYLIPKGTYITITLLSFRNIFVAESENVCLDFIQFVDGRHSPTSERICNVELKNGPTLVFDIPQQDIRVVINIDNGTKINEPLEELPMVTTTAPSQCNPKDDFLCDPKTVNTPHLNVDMKPCIKRKSLEEKLDESSQLILKAYKAFEDRLIAVENFLKEYNESYKKSYEVN